MNTITNLSTSPYRATLQEIQQCMLPPRPEDGDTMQGASLSPFNSEYRLSTQGYCDKCNRGYHRSCDDMFQWLSAKYQLQFDKKNPESMQNVLRLCEVPPNVETLSPFKLGELKKQYDQVRHTTGVCLQMRKNHHFNCSENIVTGKRGPDPGHKEWLKQLSRVGEKCSKSLERVRKVKEVATPQKTPVLKLETPSKRSIATLEQSPVSDEVSRKLKF